MFTHLQICCILLNVFTKVSGQIVTLTGSASLAVAGQPFTFTCASDEPYMPYVEWSVHLRNTTENFRLYSLSDSFCTGDTEYPRYNLTCRPSGPFTLTILKVDYWIHQHSNWSCYPLLTGRDSNVIQLEVNVFLATVTLHDSHRSSLSVTKGDIVSFDCETNPTYPASSIRWIRGDQSPTQGVTSRSRDNGGLVVTFSTFTFEATSDTHDKDIYCIGTYEGTEVQSETVRLNIYAPLSYVRISNMTGDLYSVTENELISLECKTNPSHFPASLSWSKGGENITHGVTERNEDDSGGRVIVSTLSFTVTCTDHKAGVQCLGTYKDIRVTSQQLSLFVHCTPTGHSGPCNSGFGAGVGTGIGVSLFLSAVTAGVLFYLWKRRKNEAGKENKEVDGPNTDIQLRDTSTAENTYDIIDDQTRQTKIRDTYEDLKVYENAHN